MNTMGSRASAKKRILIVDDSEDMRLLLTQILEEEEIYELFLAETGAQALEQSLQVRPDLILMDMSLPGMTGWEVVSQLRKMPDFADIPIVAVTAHVSVADQERALSIGCNEHLGKPFDVMDVLDMVDRLLGE